MHSALVKIYVDGDTELIPEEDIYVPFPEPDSESEEDEE